MGTEQSFGQVVKARRRELGLTQDELARRVGCAPVTIRKIEYDDLRPSVQIAERLAMALNIALEERGAFVRLARAERQPEPLTPTPAPRPEEIGIEDLTGKAIRGYALGERVGSGGMGAVYRAVQPLVEREVAIKIILPQYANHPDFIRRFEAEAQLVARLEHPHIVPLYDYWREPSVAYLVMRLLRGGSLQRMLEHGPIPLDMTLRMMEQVGSALGAAHRAGVIHRDLKPGNVLLDEDQNAYLADFGIAKNLGNPNLEDATQVDAIIGSPAYISPEQIRSEFVRPQTDIYCLGVVLYELLTGDLPFTGPTPIEVMHQHLNAPLPPLAARRAGLPGQLDAVIERATAKEPLERYPDVESLLADLRLAASGQWMGESGRRPAPTTDHRPLTTEENPYKGLRAFGEGDAADFFGREALTQQLLVRMGEGGDLSRFLAVVGPSGSGKSSVVGAGLVPALRRGGLPGSDQWFIIELMPGPRPFEELEAALLRVAVNPPESLLSQLKEDERGLLRAVRRCLPDNPTVELVLVIDQFEEVFTLLADEPERALLLSSLVTAALDERSRVRVVITLRADFTDRPLRYVDFGELLRQRMEVVLPLTPDELERAIIGPAERVGLQFESGLAAAIMRDVSDQPGALPLLQYALTELFEKRDGNVLTKEAYAAIGGVLGALGRRAEEVFASLDPIAQATARQLFLRLVTLGEGVEDTRRRALRSELESLTTDRRERPLGQSLRDRPSRSIPLGLTTVLDAFGKSRLLSFDRDPLTRGPTVEVAHEALLREWPRLREWLAESRADVRLQRILANASTYWLTADRDAGLLLRDTRLTQLESWMKETTLALTGDERTFLEASIEARRARQTAEIERQKRERALEQRSRRFLRTLVGVFAIATIIALFLTNFAFSQRNLAQNEAQSRATQQAIAEANLTGANALRLAAEANSMLLSNGPPDLIALLSVRSMNMHYSASGDAALESAALLGPSPRQFSGHTAAVSGVAFSPDGKYLATGSNDKTARLWDLASGETIRVFSADSGEVGEVAFAPDGKYLLTAGADNTARLWDVASGQTVKDFSGHIAAVWYVAFSPDGKYIATTSDDQTARIWEVATGETLHVLSGRGSILTSVAFSPDGKYMLTGSVDNTARLWDAATGSQVWIFSGHTAVVTRVAYSPDGKYVATASEDHTARLWDAASGQMVREFSGHQGAVRGIEFSPDGRFLLTGSADKTARLWYLASGQTVHIFGGSEGDLYDVTFSPDGRLLATANGDGLARIWKLQPAPGELLFVGHTAAIWHASFSPDGKYILTASDDGTARMWEAATGKNLLSFVGHTNAIKSAIFSPDGKTVLTTSWDQTAQLWDAATSEPLLLFAGHTGPVRLAAFSPDGNYIVTASYDGTARVWDAHTAKTIVTYTNQGPGHVNRVAFSPNGKTVVTSGDDGTARIWDPLTGKEIMVFTGHTDIVAGVAFSPDGKQVVTASFDGSVRLWDVTTGTEVRRFAGHPGGAYGAAFSPNGTHVVTTGADDTARVWEVASGAEVRRFTGHTNPVRNVVFSPDGNYILTASDDNTARLWHTDYHDTIRFVCDLLTRDLTPDERTQYGILDDEPTCPVP